MTDVVGHERWLAGEGWVQGTAGRLMTDVVGHERWLAGEGSGLGTTTMLVGSSRQRIGGLRGRTNGSTLAGDPGDSPTSHGGGSGIAYHHPGRWVEGVERIGAIPPPRVGSGGRLAKALVIPATSRLRDLGDDRPPASPAARPGRVPDARGYPTGVAISAKFGQSETSRSRTIEVSALMSGS